MPTFSAGEQVSTPVGLSIVDVPEGNTALSIPFLNRDLYRGTIVGLIEDGPNQTATLMLEDASWTLGRFDEGTFPKFYAEIQETSHYVGLGLDIIESGANWIKVAGLAQTDFGIASGDTLVIRAHYVIDELFASLTAAEKNEQRRCLIKLFYPDGTTELASWTGSAWASSSGVVTTGETPIYPGQGFIISNNNPLTLVHTGNVRTTPLLIPVYEDQSWNFFGSAYPVGTTIGAMQLESFLIPSQDELKTYEAGSLATIYTYTSNGSYLSRDVGNDNSGDPFPPQEAASIQTGQSGYYPLPSFFQP